MNNKNDDTLIKSAESMTGQLSSTHPQINLVTVNVDETKKRERSVEDIVTDNFKQKLNDLLRKALIVESRRRSASNQNENGIVNMNAMITSDEEEITEELLDIERKFAYQHELLKENVKIDDEQSTKERTACIAKNNCKTNAGQKHKNKELAVPKRFSDNRLSKKENLSQTRYDSLLSLVENHEEKVDLLELEKKYKELLLKMLDKYEKDTKEAGNGNSKRTGNDDGEDWSYWISVIEIVFSSVLILPVDRKWEIFIIILV